MANATKGNIAMTNNDEKILELRNKIQQKKDGLVEQYKRPTTNCIITLDGETYNINTLKTDRLLPLLIKLNAYRLSMIDLGYKDIQMCGYKLTDWIDDIKNKIGLAEYKDKKNELDDLELKLSRLLSNDKKIELELSEIEKMI